MPANPTRTVHVRGMEVEAEHIEDRPSGGARLDIEHPDGRRWRVVVTSQGTVSAVVTERDADGQLVEPTEPEWLGDALRRLAGAPA
jgi:hypothetical protein